MVGTLHPFIAASVHINTVLSRLSLGYHSPRSVLVYLVYLSVITHRGRLTVTVYLRIVNTSDYHYHYELLATIINSNLVKNRRHPAYLVHRLGGVWILAFQASELAYHLVLSLSFLMIPRASLYDA